MVIVTDLRLPEAHASTTAETDSKVEGRLRRVLRSRQAITYYYNYLPIVLKEFCTVQHVVVGRLAVLGYNKDPSTCTEIQADIRTIRPARATLGHAIDGLLPVNYPYLVLWTMLGQKRVRTAESTAPSR
jgi:hypothetical protein